jgi:hypothetical protein
MVGARRCQTVPWHHPAVISSAVHTSLVIAVPASLAHATAAVVLWILFAGNACVGLFAALTRATCRVQSAKLSVSGTTTRRRRSRCRPWCRVMGYVSDCRFITLSRTLKWCLERRTAPPDTVKGNVLIARKSRTIAVRLIRTHDCAPPSASLTIIQAKSVTDLVEHYIR